MLTILTEEEINEFLDYNGESDEGAIAVATTIKDLSLLNVGTDCGKLNNACFTGMGKFSNRKIKGWLLADEAVMMGMIHIQCDESEAKEIERLAEYNGGSLRASGPSLLNGFYEFENE